jgi:hypothetical protein
MKKFMSTAIHEHLIREDQKRHDENRLEQMLLDGLRSGPGIRMNPKQWKKLWAEVDAQVNTHSSAIRGYREDSKSGCGGE